ncbi:MAG: DUF2786 domain-containing protein [Ignavibacteriae bacterium]|nr:DUF2786 domain-containing protein [Ignavibacteriota bacterium]
MTSPIIGKIRKLLALAGSPNEHEASLALAKAREMQREYGISDSDLAQAEFVIQQCNRSTWRSRPIEQPWIFSLLKAYFKVIPVIITTGAMEVLGCDWIYCGKPHDILIAEYVHDYLMRVAKQRWSIYEKSLSHRIKRRGKIERHRAFLHGFFCAVSERLDAQNRAWYNETGIVVHADAKLVNFVDQYLGGALSKRSINKGKSDQSFVDGFVQGVDVDIAKPVSAAQSNNRLVCSEGQAT